MLWDVAELGKVSIIATNDECSTGVIELDISVQNKQEAEKIKEIMESTVTLEVPNKVDYEEGDNWGSIK